MFFDPKKYSDDELIIKETELRGKLLSAARFSSSDAVSQLQTIIAQIGLERRERAIMKIMKSRIGASSVCIETDPVLAQENIKETEAEVARKTVKPASRPKPFSIIKPTSKPSAEK